ncbi:hypothetical protein G5I_11735 [Acromyrmex echinatior]|uniref:Uncharacterized protein n=1 Tax=Acromyrmex echinatior TaxID=103372 RepID=F4X0E3_ACREC|nr:hypothetical protein G5I_11735 [Acromyrmex echinatior]
MPLTTNNINSTLVNVSSSRDKETPRISARLHPTVTWEKTENSQKITAPFLPSLNPRPEESLFFNQPLKEITHRSKYKGKELMIEITDSNRNCLALQLCKKDIIESSKVVRASSVGNSSDILRHCAVTCHALSRSSRAFLSPSRARPIGVPTATGQPNRRPARSLAPA